jgi:predicted transcriptional regulator
MGLQENIRNDRIDQLELREPVSVSPDVSLRETLTTMRSRNIGCAAVVDKDNKPIGIFTESMLTELLSHGSVKMEKPVQEYMAERYPWVRTTDPVAELLEAMQLKNVRMLCVVDKQDRLVGLTGQRGLMEFISDHFPGQIMVQRVGLTPFPADREGA